MKPRSILFLCIMIFSFTRVMAQYPIPSYNIDVRQNASFQEQKQDNLVNPMTVGKKEVSINGHSPTLPSGISCAIVWVYRLDNQEILGPYNLANDVPLQVPIDDRAWGVYMEVSTELSVDVWIDGGL